MASGLVAVGDIGARDFGAYRLLSGLLQIAGVDVLISYGQVKGRRYDNHQALPGKSGKKRRYKRPILYDGVEYESAAELAKAVGVSDATISYHLHKHTPLFGKNIRHL